MMADYHRAFAPELKAIIESLPIRRGERVLDFACGDGSYSRWLARHVGPAGKVLALDISPAFLDVARQSALRSTMGRRIEFLQADIHRLPVAANSLDLVWCAQSLYSLPDPIDALLQRMAKAVRPGRACGRARERRVPPRAPALAGRDRAGAQEGRTDLLHRDLRSAAEVLRRPRPLPPVSGRRADNAARPRASSSRVRPLWTARPGRSSPPTWKTFVSASVPTSSPVSAHCSIACPILVPSCSCSPAPT